jgi:hypothetical protein
MEEKPMLLILFIVLLFLFAGGGSYRTYHYGYADPLGGVVWLFLVVLVVWALTGGVFTHPIY